MALAYSIKRRGTAGDLAFRIVDVTLDDAYAAGGYDLSEKSLGFGTNGTIWHVTTSPSVGGFTPEWDPATGKLLVRDASGSAGAASPEVADDLAGLDGLVARLMVWGDGHG